MFASTHQVDSERRWYGNNSDPELAEKLDVDGCSYVR